MSGSVTSSGSSSAAKANTDIVQETAAPRTYDSSIKDVRIWMDGAFDMMHFGHMNAFRLCKALGMALFNFYFE